MTRLSVARATSRKWSAGRNPLLLNVRHSQDRKVIAPEPAPSPFAGRHHRVRFAARGYQVTAYCRSPASAQKFDSFIQIAWRKILKRPLQRPERLAKVAVVDTIAEAVASADYVQESCLEEIALKQSIIQQIDEHAPPHVIIGTSSCTYRSHSSAAARRDTRSASRPCTLPCRNGTILWRF